MDPLDIHIVVRLDQQTNSQRWSRDLHTCKSAYIYAYLSLSIGAHRTRHSNHLGYDSDGPMHFFYVGCNHISLAYLSNRRHGLKMVRQNFFGVGA